MDFITVAKSKRNLTAKGTPVQSYLDSMILRHRMHPDLALFSIPLVVINENKLNLPQELKCMQALACPANNI